MQNKINKNSSGVPFLSSLPFIGNLFSYKDDEMKKTELVIFLKPSVISNASLDGDLRKFREYLPDLAATEASTLDQFKSLVRLPRQSETSETNGTQP